MRDAISHAGRLTTPIRISPFTVDARLDVRACVQITEPRVGGEMLQVEADGRVERGHLSDEAVVEGRARPNSIRAAVSNPCSAQRCRIAQPDARFSCSIGRAGNRTRDV